MGCIQSKNQKELENDSIDLDIEPKIASNIPAPPGLEERKNIMMETVSRDILKARALIRNVENEKIYRYVGELNGIDISVDGIKDSELYVFDTTAQVQIDEALNSKILIGPCEGSVFIRNCKNCTMYIMGNQLRTRDCENCTIYLYCPTEPVIEMSHGLRIGYWNVSYPGLRRLFVELGMDKTTNLYNKIHDFTANHESLPPIHWVQIPDADVQAASCILTPEKGEPFDGDIPSNPVDAPELDEAHAHTSEVNVEYTNAELNPASIDANDIQLEF